MNHAKEIQDLFYNKHPELNKLEFGVEVMVLPLSKYEVFTFVGKTMQNQINSDSKRFWHLIAHHQNKTRSYEYTNDTDFKVLGKPITTLQAISLLPFYAIDHNGVLCKAMAGGADGFHYKPTSLRLDPTLPLLRDQSEEVQKQLWELTVKEK